MMLSHDQWMYEFPNLVQSQHNDPENIRMTMEFETHGALGGKRLERHKQCSANPALFVLSKA